MKQFVGFAFAISFLVFYVQFNEAVAKVADPQITSALQLYNICLSQHVPEDLRTREDWIDAARCEARLNFVIQQLKGRCMDTQPAQWFLNYWDRRGGIGLYDKGVREVVEAMLGQLPKGATPLSPGCFPGTK